jgi:two-component system sensor histidine kinase UhpB
MLEAMLEAREALHQSEARLRLAVRGSHTGLWDWDVATDVVYLSPEWKRQLGYEDHEIGTGLDEWIERLHPDEREGILREQRFLGASGGSQYEAEFRLRHKDGSYRWIYSRAELIRTSDGAPLRMVGTHVDITPRKSLEQRLEQTIEALREQSMRMIDVGEAERRSISRELHDRTGANIAALQITLRLLGDKLNDGDSEAAAELADDAREVLSDMSSEIRNIMSELRPAALDDFGLYPALLSYARHVASRLSIEVKWVGGTVEPRPPGAIETALFRIAQEALTNAAKHAHATLLEIALERQDGMLVLEVADNGVGFDAADHARGHGMRTMRERADAIRGTIRVSSAPGAGTRVTVEVPLP